MAEKMYMLQMADGNREAIDAGRAKELIFVGSHFKLINTSMLCVLRKKGDLPQGPAPKSERYGGGRLRHPFGVS